MLALFLPQPPHSSAQSPAPAFNPLPPIAFDTSGPVIRAHTEALKPFTVAGERGVIVGQQDGTFEAWLLPVKLLSHLTIEADIEGYTVPIDVNQQSAEIEVRPDRTVITYAHIGFTVRQIMFSPADAPAGTGPVVLFEFDCLHPTDFTLRFTPELRWMWPERNEGVPGVEWVAPGAQRVRTRGRILRAARRLSRLRRGGHHARRAAGILAPYQERPAGSSRGIEAAHRPGTGSRESCYPLLMAYGAESRRRQLRPASARHWKSSTPPSRLSTRRMPKLEEDACQLRLHRNPRQGPERSIPVGGDLHRAAQDQNHPGQSAAPAPDTGTVPDETALVAGYYASGDSARPGFGWFFGRDALYTLYAVNGYGDFSLSRSELEFLISRQRADGKIMHEWSQTAAAIDWRSFPYMYAAADATPLFLLATLDYVRASGDVAFLTRASRRHREGLGV